jgi:transcriptional regulator with XRE-family HTH domain
MTEIRADDWQPRPYGVADRLREAREAAGMQQKEVAAALKWDPAKLSKTESGARTPNADDVRAWAEVTGLSDARRDEIIDALARFRSEQRTWKDKLRQGRRAVQVEYNRLYRDCTRFQMLQIAWVPGILQTPDYARQVFINLNEFEGEPDKDVEGDVTARMQRRDYLNDLSKSFEILIAQSVLTDQIVDPPVLRSQLQRLLDIMDLPNVRFGIIPQQGVRRRIALQVGFAIYDELAVIEDPVTQTPYHGEAAERLSRVVAGLWGEAVEGDQAREMIRAARDGIPRS